MTEIEAYRARTAELLADYDARLTAVIDADHEAALLDDQPCTICGNREMHISHRGIGHTHTPVEDLELRAEYHAYLCSMIDHGCDCLALDFERWHQVVIADQLVTDLQHLADLTRDDVRRRPYERRHTYAVGHLMHAIRHVNQDRARAVADGVEQGIAARVPL